MNSNSVEILLVDDNKGDVGLTIEAFRDAKIKNNLHICYDGVEAMDYLNLAKDRKLDNPMPDLMLLDLNMPRKSGREVLEEVRADEDLKMIPIIILTTSNADIDITGSYSCNANCYITKPVDFDNFIKVVQGIESFWLNIVKLPIQH